ncbi:unnamed protein product [marine sediment metagenome]|uniref:SMP-30/Gluconolactonase/LRE-like region domain-containing protein n=1 Tax=marine sediment metagenome TaxID=412755 RepID=X1S6W5_9ZZZZ
MQWDVTDAVYRAEFDVSGKEDSPRGVFFKPDGTKMYTIGSDGDTVDEYDLGTQWDVTSAVYRDEFSVAAKEVVPQSVFFKPDGTKMYVGGDDGNTVDEYDLGTQWDVTTAVYRTEISIAVREAGLSGVFFKPDGTKMYTIGYDGKTVDEYDLGTQWDVATAVYRAEISIAVREDVPSGVFFKPDGTKMYIVGYDGDTVDEYDLGTQWNVTAAVYLREFSVAAKESVPTGLFFKPDGTKMYTVGVNGITVDEYDLC